MEDDRPPVPREVRRPILGASSSKFSVSADGRLQALPSLPPLPTPPSPPGSRVVNLHDHSGAMQGVGAAAGIADGDKKRDDAIDDALLVSRNKHARGGKLHSRFDESDLVAGRSEKELSTRKDQAREFHPFDDDASHVDVEAQGDNAEDWQQLRRPPPQKQQQHEEEQQRQAQSHLMATSRLTHAQPAQNPAATRGVAAVALPPACVSSSEAPTLARADSNLSAGSCGTSGGITPSASLDGGSGGNAGGLGGAIGGLSSSLGSSSNSLGASTRSLPSVPVRDSTAGAGAKWPAETSAEGREKQLLAQIKDLTRQLDKEKHRKKEQGAHVPRGCTGA